MQMQQRIRIQLKGEIYENKIIFFLFYFLIKETVGKLFTIWQQTPLHGNR